METRKPRLTRAQTAASKAACTVCHRRKVRCDAHEVGTPCTNCSKLTTRRENCRIHEKAKRASRRRPWAEIPHERDQPAAPAAPSAEDGNQTSPEDLSELEVLDQTEAHDTTYNVGFAILDATTRETDYMNKRHLVEFVDQPLIDQRPIDKNSRVVYLGAEVANLHYLASQHFGQRTSRVSHYPTNRLERRQTCHEPDRLPVEALELPPRAAVDQILQAYFTHVNPGFPVVDEDLFWEQYRARDPHNPPSLLLLHAMLVVGAHVLHADDPAKRASTKAVFFRRAKSLFDARFERNRDTLVQVALLLSWHTDGPEDVAANAWFWIGVAMRTATGLGMHRDADGSTVVPHNKRMWRRVWWLLFRCDVMLSLQYGRPRSVRLEECDVKPVQPDDFQNCGPRTNISYVTQSIELAIITYRLLESRFALTSSPYKTAPTAHEDGRRTVRELNQTLARWSLDLPDDLGPRAGHRLGLWSACLQLQYNTILILLHRTPPWKEQLREDSDVCAVAAACIVSLLQTICDSGGFKSLWISAVNCIFTALIQMDVQVRTSSPALAMPALMQYDNTVALLRRFSDYWPNALPVLHFFEHLRDPNSMGSGEKLNFPSENTDTDIADPQPTSPLAGRSLSRESVIRSAENMDSMLKPRPSSATSSDANAARLLAVGQNSLIAHGQHQGMVDKPAPANAVPGDERAMSDISEAWHEWRNTHWQNADMVEEFPFVF